MNFCKECGRELTAKARFCKHCGFQADGSGTSISEESARQDIHKPKMSKKKIIVLGAIVVCCVLLFAGYKTGEALTSKEKLISDFENALDHEDAEKAAQLLQSSDVDLAITKENVKPLLTYLKENPDDEKELISSLKSDSGNQLVSIEKSGRHFFIYDRYVLNVAPVYLTIKTNYKDTDLFVNGKKVMTTQKENFERKFGPYVPGVYEVKAKLKNDLTELKKTEKVEALESDVNVDVAVDGHKAKLVFEDGYEKLKGTLWIDGQKTNIDPFKGTSFGPVLTDGSMSAEVEGEFPWGTLKSAKTPIDSSDIQVNLASDQTFMDQMMKTLVKHTKEEMKALASGNVNDLTVAAPSYKSDLKEIIAGYKSSGTYYKGTYLSTVFDLDSFRLYNEDGKWKTDIDGVEKHKSAYFDDYSSPDMAENENGFTYTLVYSGDQHKWLVEQADPSSFINIENKKEIKNDKPQEYTSAWASEKGASKNTSSGEELTDRKVESAIEGYLYSLQDAINENDFSLVADNLQKGSSLYNDQKALVKKLNGSGTQEEVVDFSVTSWKQNGSAVTIKTEEKINIIKNGKEQVKTYHWTYQAVVEDGEVLLTSIQ
ncbi:zinc ribbon domain-containing protein [Bacillus sp. NSP9.1]|uniref:zinc ribbon domain-containing protein n=1 Tax=Bacillus sp. NSP9.1 TaxID=1071078 RepID=UPI0003F69E1E|nr:zinc ribbon domain-containing protein [Bacillus sp. NSP9.1]QHZ45547.1 zinc ribbon domain-containing protein [Bacillus sp. NSP9.1]